MYEALSKHRFLTASSLYYLTLFFSRAFPDMKLPFFLANNILARQLIYIYSNNSMLIEQYKHLFLVIFQIYGIAKSNYSWYAIK